ncbi:MAG TPA: hypothetical protein VGM98_18125 [Schlesneria sp.]|jgi:hypothetical protein
MGNAELFDAVVNSDPERILRLLQCNSALRTNPVVNGRSLFDIVDEMSDAGEIGASTATELRNALLHSRNPDAPSGYSKPQAFHGSPWGFEILESEKLKCGANDPKGGKCSLEGKVFFSDRTPVRDGAPITRADLRSKARAYSEGNGVKPENAANRGLIYRMTQVVLEQLERGGSMLSFSANRNQPLVVDDIENSDAVREAVKTYLAEALHAQRKCFKFADRSRPSLAPVRLPTKLEFAAERSGKKSTVRGALLVELYRVAAKGLREDLERGKAPFLSVINNGQVVPLVFGFEKVWGLGSHYIERKGVSSYQNVDHPLVGTRNTGGRLREIEVRNLHDLGTVMLASLSRGTHIPADTVVRVKGSKGKFKARYLTQEQYAGFEKGLLKALHPQESRRLDELRSYVAGMSIGDLQGLNAQLRQLPLGRIAKWIPDREHSGGAPEHVQESACRGDARVVGNSGNANTRHAAFNYVSSGITKFPDGDSVPSTTPSASKADRLIQLGLSFLMEAEQAQLERRVRAAEAWDEDLNARKLRRNRAFEGADSPGHTTNALGSECGVCWLSKLPAPKASTRSYGSRLYQAPSSVEAQAAPSPQPKSVSAIVPANVVDKRRYKYLYATKEVERSGHDDAPNGP